MKLQIAWIGKTKEPAIQSLTDEYLRRISRYVPTEGVSLRDEAALLALCGRPSPGLASSQKTKPAAIKSTLALLDSRGKQLTSEEFAQFLGDYQDRNRLPLIFAIGPADGFGEAIRCSAQFAFSLGKMTLPHELARVVLLEQIYRGITILKGHPYHCGH